MMFREELGFESLESKIALKRVHSYIGYIFVVNLLLRGFAGLRKKADGKSGIQPATLWQFLAHTMTGKPTHARTTRASSESISLILFILMTLSAATGLIRASTDVYLPPLGTVVTTWLANSPELANTLDPLSDDHVNQSRLSSLNRLKVPVGLIHKWSAYLMILALLIHILIAMEFSRRPTSVYNRDFSGTHKDS